MRDNEAADPATGTPWQREQMRAWRRRHGRDRHERQIAEWAARQQYSREWMNFAEIADWCACELGGVDRDEDRRAQAYRDLARSVLAGEFNRAGRWYVVRLPDGPTQLTEPLRLRVTLEWLRKWSAFRDGTTVPDQELARWWAPRDLCARWFEARQMAAPPRLSAPNGREQLLSQARAAGSFDPALRRNAVFGLIYDSLSSRACTSTEILEAAYGDADGRAYWEAWLFEPMLVYQFAKLFAVHRAAVEGAPTASFNGKVVPVLDGFLRQVFEALRAAALSGEQWFMKVGQPGIAVQPPDSALSAVWAQMGEGRNLAVLSRDAIAWMTRNPNARHLVPAAAAVVAAQAPGTTLPRPANTKAGISGTGEAGSAAHACVAAYRTGLAGRPTSWHLLEAECRRRYVAGERYPKVAEWARVLIAWLRVEHPSAPPTTAKAVTNKLSPVLRELKAKRPK